MTTKMYVMPNSPIAAGRGTPLALLRAVHPAYTPAGNLAWDHEHDCGIVCGEVVVPHGSDDATYRAAAALAPEYTDEQGRVFKMFGRAGVDYLSGKKLEEAMIAAGLGTTEDIDPAVIQSMRYQGPAK